MKMKRTTMGKRASLPIDANILSNQSRRRTMKNNIFTYAVLGCMAGTLLAGCDKKAEPKVEPAQEQKVGDAKQDLKDARANYVAEWQAFKTESEQKIEANEKRIDAFKQKMEHAGTKVKAQYKKDVAALKEKNRELKKKLEEYKDEGQGKWEEFKTNFNNDMDSVGKTMKDLFKDKD
jgi:predicted RNase H-like nuclease (RuvC/YqgF family)